MKVAECLHAAPVEAPHQWCVRCRAATKAPMGMYVCVASIAVVKHAVLADAGCALCSGSQHLTCTAPSKAAGVSFVTGRLLPTGDWISMQKVMTVIMMAVTARQLQRHKAGSGRDCSIAAGPSMEW